MIVIKTILEERHIVKFLEKRNLINQYKRAKINILRGNITSTNLKIRQPKKDSVWYFRINDQYRAICIHRNNTLYVADIDAH